MTTKEYLSQAHRIDQRINSKLEQIKSLRSLAEKATSTLSGMPKSDTPNTSRMEEVIVKMIDLEEEINADIATLVDLKREISTVIKQVDNLEHQTLLEQRYLCFMRWEDIAVQMTYSMQHLFRHHNDALKAVEAKR